MHNRCTPHIKQILAFAPVAGAVTLPLPDVRQAMLHCDPFTQFGPSLCGQLPFAQLFEQAFVRVNAHRSADFATGAALPQGAATTTLCPKLDVRAWREGQHDPSRTTNLVLLPIQHKGRFGKVRPIVDPGQALQAMDKSSSRSRTRLLLN